MIVDGKVLTRRGANKKYPELDDVDALYERVRRDQEHPLCPTDLAKELGVPQNCVLWRLKLLPEEKQNNVYQKRCRHKRRVSKKQK